MNLSNDHGQSILVQTALVGQPSTSKITYIINILRLQVSQLFQIHTQNKSVVYQ